MCVCVCVCVCAFEWMDLNDNQGTSKREGERVDTTDKSLQYLKLHHEHRLQRLQAAAAETPRP